MFINTLVSFSLLPNNNEISKVKLLLEQTLPWISMKVTGSNSFSEVRKCEPSGHPLLVDHILPWERTELAYQERASMLPSSPY